MINVAMPKDKEIDRAQLNEQYKEKYNLIKQELESNAAIQYIVIDISSDCDIAQKKIYLSRLIPGIMIPYDDYERYCKDKKIKSKCPDYIFELHQVEINSAEWIIFFNANQLFSTDYGSLPEESALYAITRSFITELKQKTASCISKHGIEVFKELSK